MRELEDTRDSLEQLRNELIKEYDGLEHQQVVDRIQETSNNEPTPVEQEPAADETDPSSQTSGNENNNNEIDNDENNNNGPSDTDVTDR